ncbi:MAG: cytochrome-c peroxidase [Limisphaerales bacterium]|jgi:cytochrome c peroxidase
MKQSVNLLLLFVASFIVFQPSGLTETLLDNTTQLQAKPTPGSFALKEHHGRVLGFTTGQDAYRIDSFSVLVDQNDTAKNATAELGVTVALFRMVEDAGQKKVPFGPALVTQTFTLLEVPHQSKTPNYYSFALDGFEIGAGQSYAIGLVGVTGLKTNLGSLRWRMCGGDNPVMGSPSGWSYESWFTSNSGGSSWGNRNSKDTAVFMEGTRLEEPVLPLPLPLEDADFHDEGQPNLAKVKLGKLLFFDKLLSGNRNIACATCHHPLTGTTDSLSLSIGEGGRSLGMSRIESDTIHERVPRNSPALFNLGAKEFKTFFHDGRVLENPYAEPGDFTSPAGTDLPEGFDNALAVQAMFPVTSPTEMAGQYDGVSGVAENEIAEQAAAGNLPRIWNLLAKRLQGVDEYVALFQSVYPDEVKEANDITFVHAANAIAAFEASQWRADQSPFDQYLRGSHDALNASQLRGMKLFYGKAECADCHSGQLLTDQSFHAIGMPQLGPGKGDGAFGYEDFGRERVTGASRDRYKFRTPALRNVALTGPWGHAGSYRRLKDVVMHHLQPERSLKEYDPLQAILPSLPALDSLDGACMENNAAVQAIADRVGIMPLELSADEINDLVSFLHALTDASSLNVLSQIPLSVPSGLPVGD